MVSFAGVETWVLQTAEKASEIFEDKLDRSGKETKMSLKDQQKISDLVAAGLQKKKMAGPKKSNTES